MARDGKKILQDMAKANAENLKNLKSEKALQENIAAILTKKVQGQRKLNDDQKQLLSDLQGEKDVSAKLTKIQDAKQKILEQQAATGTNIGKKLLEQLDTLEFYVQMEKERKDLADEIKNITEENEQALFTSLGTLGDMLKAGTAIAAAMALFKGLTEQIGKAFENTVGQAVKLNQELGISSAQALEMGFQNLSTDAIFSRFTIEQLNQATESLATTLGTTAGISNDLRNSVAELSAMGVGGDQAAMLAQSFEGATGSAVDMTAEIKEMANDAGVMASVTFKDLAAQQRLMVGMTKEELKELTKKTIELNKQGLTLADMQGISEKMMDIEGTMRAQAKARVALQGKGIDAQLAGMSELTAAGLEFQRTGDDSKLQETLKKLNMDAATFNELGPRGQQLYADAIGMGADQLAEQIRKQEQMAKFEKAGIMGEAAKGLLETYERIPGGIKEATTGLIAFIGQMAIMNIMQTGNSGIGRLTEKFGLSTIATKAQTVATKAFTVVENIKNKAIQLGTAIMNSQMVTRIKDSAIKAKDFVLDKGRLAAEKAMNAARLVGSTIMKSEIAQRIALTAQKVAGNIATFIGIGATTGQTTANVALATSQTTLATTGAAAGGGMAAAGAGLGAFGAAAAPAIPVILAIGAALLLASPAIYAFSFVIEALGKIIIGVLAAVPPIVTAIAEGFVMIMGAVTPENVMGLLMLGPALLSASVGMIAFSAAMAVGGIMSFFGGGIVDQIRELSEIGPGVEQAGAGLAAVAGNIAIISGAMGELGGLVTPLYALAGGLMSISGGLAAMALTGLLAMPVIGGLIALAAIAPALEGLGSFLGGGDDDTSSSDDALINEIKGLRSDIQAQPIMLTIDGKAVQSISRVQNRQSKTTRGFS